jgi:hypothetical protein
MNKIYTNDGGAKMSKRMYFGLKGLDGYEKDYMVFQMGKLNRRNHWSHAESSA